MTAYEIRISDWSSDVCSSDLLGDGVADRGVGLDGGMGGGLDRGDLGGDIVGGARGLVGEALHLLGDDREAAAGIAGTRRSEEHTSELQSLMRISYAVFCLKKKK